MFELSGVLYKPYHSFAYPFRKLISFLSLPVSPLFSFFTLSLCIYFMHRPPTKSLRHFGNIVVLSFELYKGTIITSDFFTLDVIACLVEVFTFIEIYYGSYKRASSQASRQGGAKGPEGSCPSFAQRWEIIGATATNSISNFILSPQQSNNNFYDLWLSKIYDSYIYWKWEWERARWTRVVTWSLGKSVSKLMKRILHLLPFIKYSYDFEFKSLENKNGISIIKFLWSDSHITLRQGFKHPLALKKNIYIYNWFRFLKIFINWNLKYFIVACTQNVRLLFSPGLKGLYFIRKNWLDSKWKMQQIKIKSIGYMESSCFLILPFSRFSTLFADVWFAIFCQRTV